MQMDLVPFLYHRDHIGILPGVGATTASFFGYSEAVRFSKHPEKFGNGAIEGVAGPESANNGS
jgi:putative tricarboxylic transport membrane protein